MTDFRLILRGSVYKCMLIENWKLQSINFNIWIVVYLLDVDPGGNVKVLPKGNWLGALAAPATASAGLFRTGIVGTPRKW